MPSTRLTDDHSHAIHSLVDHDHHHPASIVADPLASLHDVITEEDVAAAQDVVDATVGGVLGEDEEEAAALRAGEEAAAAAMEGALGTRCVLLARNRSCLKVLCSLDVSMKDFFSPLTFPA
jgi:hypothetical protein